MLLFVIAFIGGVLTILSPCILPVVPFVFARSDRSFMRGTLPLLAGMVITFAAVATLAAVGGNWAVNANQYGRLAAMIVLTFFAVTLLSPALAEWASRPLVGLGSRLSNSASGETSMTSSLLLGIATGLLWAPCAGPILGLILTGAALQGPSARTTLLLLAYAAGAATSLAVALFAGGRVFAAMKKSLGADEWIRRGLGVLVLVSVVAIAMGMDTGLLARLSLAGTTAWEQALLNRFQPTGEPARQVTTAQQPAGEALPVEGIMPPLDGAVTWLNSPPLTTEGLRGKVVMIDFWTYSCINCLRTLPYVKAWAQKYKDYGLVVIGVHSPEFAFEQDVGNVTKAVHDLGITYPVAVDSQLKIWRAFQNEAWPAHYFVDVQGRIRAHHFGEGEYQESEKFIQTLLTEGGAKNVPTSFVNANGEGIEAAPDGDDLESPETYIGFLRAMNFASPGGYGQGSKNYSIPAKLGPDQWGLGGQWTVDEEKGVLDRAGGRIAFAFHARDLHLVLGPGKDGKPVRFRVMIDGKEPGDSHGVDTDATGAGVVTSQKLYQLVRLAGPVADHVFEIEFLDPGVEAYSFTFG